MVTLYAVKLGRQAVKDLEKLKSAGLSAKAKRIVDLLKVDPYQNPPPYEKLTGDLSGFYSRRINIKHRLVYSVHEVEKIVAVHRMWTHYE